MTSATVLVELTTSIIKLKDCWYQIRNAPEDFKWLMQEIETFSAILAEGEADIAQGSLMSSLVNSKHAVQSFDLCRKASKQLDLVVQELGRDLDSPSNHRRSYAAVKIVIHKSKLEKYRSRLQDVKGLLLLSQQCYMRALVQVQPQLIAKMVAREILKSQMGSNSSASMVIQGSAHQSNGWDIETLPNRSTAGLSSPTGPEAAGAVQRRNPRTVRHHNYTWRLRIPVPSWITSKALELAGLRAPDGWKLALRTYNMISGEAHSKAVSFMRRGDIQGLQHLFATKQVSPFDRLEDGATLLHYANGPKKAEVFAFLLDQGIDPHLGLYSEPDWTALSILVWNIDAKPLLPSLRCLLARSELIYETPEETVNGVLSRFYGTAEEFILLQQECCPTYFQMPQLTRIAVAASCSYSNGRLTPELIRAALGKDPLSVINLQKELPGRPGETMVSIATHHIGCALYMHANVKDHPIYETTQEEEEEHLKYQHRDAKTHEEKRKSIYAGWNALFCEFMTAGIDIHHVVGHQTPFAAFLSGFFGVRINYGYHSVNPTRTCEAALRIWLADLQIAGVNLDEFGRIEQQLYRNGDVSKDIDSGMNIVDFIDRERLVNFNYGPSSDDWHIWFSERNDAGAGDFWNLVERQADVMPGAWPEDLPYKM